MIQFAKSYPHLDWWIHNQGWIEIGEDEHSSSWIRVLDEGGLCWEDENSKTLDQALEAAEKFLKAEISERFGEEVS
jgi:hypothetical protein